jgi:cytidine deaminase
MISEKLLIEEARKAMAKAYAPYSKFKVGAALLAKNGQIYTGCNVENAAYGADICAEMTAVVKAISEGIREFTAIAIVSDSMEPTAPCGACRQVLNEFSPDIKIIMVGKHKIRKSSLKKILPYAFGPKSLTNKK